MACGRLEPVCDEVRGSPNLPMRSSPTQDVRTTFASTRVPPIDLMTNRVKICTPRIFARLNRKS
jgi:hypothetical protein